MAAMARAEGILALEQEVEGGAHDRFLSQGIILSVDGTEPDLIMDIMETEVKFIKERHDQAQRAVRVVGRNCLVMGAVASLMWLALAPGLQIEMLRILHLSALSALYGVVAWAVAIPLAHKLRSYSEMEVLAKSLAIEAVISIQSSDRPHIVEHKLSVFLPPAQRPSGDRQPVASTPAPAPIPEVAFVEEVNRLAADLGPAEFVFADITKLTDREIQILLREVDQQALVVALVGATAEIREKLTGNMSERVRVFILSETGYVADIGAEKVAGIHGAICNQVVRMSKQGQISLP